MHATLPLPHRGSSDAAGAASGAGLHESVHTVFALFIPLPRLTGGQTRRRRQQQESERKPDGRRPG